MVSVKRGPGDTNESLISKFRKYVTRSGLLDEVRERDRFVSKAEKRKEKKDRIKHQIELDKQDN